MAYREEYLRSLGLGAAIDEWLDGAESAEQEN
jgi:hypothetical protein